MSPAPVAALAARHPLVRPTAGPAAAAARLLLAALVVVATLLGAAAPALAAIPAPAPVTVTPGDRSLEVRWTRPASEPIESIAGFELRYRGSVMSGTSGWRTSLYGRETTSAVLRGLGNQTPYDVYVRLVTSAGYGLWTPVVRALPGFPPPSTPLTGVAATSRDGQAKLSWALPDAVPQAAVTRFELRTRADEDDLWGPEQTIDAQAREHLVRGLSNGTVYAFTMRAVTPQGGTPWSAAVTTKPMPASASITAQLTGAAPGQLRARWTATAGAERYELAYRSETDGSSVRRSVDASIPADELERTFAVAPGAAYTVYVRSFVGSSSSSWRQVAVVVPTPSLPTLRIATADEAPIVSKDDYLAADLDLAPAPGGPASDAYRGTTEIKGRGNSTWTMPKKPYRLKLGKAAALLGMPKSKHWVLLANWVDRTAIRNALTFELGQRTALAWTPRSRFVEVVLNGRYVGLYQLVEQIRVDAGRIGIDPLAPVDLSGDALTGGYHLERDGRWVPGGEDAGFRSSRLDQPFAIKDPEVPAPAQLAYIKGYVDEAETAIASSSFADPTVGYARYLDVPSFVDWYLVNEYVRAVDGWWSSAHMYKPRLGKLHMGPLWDFDYSMGLRSGQAQQPASGYWIRSRSDWYARLFADPAFVAQVKARWQAVRPEPGAFDASVDRLAGTVRTAAAFDRKVWSRTDDFDAEVAKLKSFMAERTAWANGQWGS